MAGGESIESSESTRRRLLDLAIPGVGQRDCDSRQLRTPGSKCDQKLPSEFPTLELDLGHDSALV